MKRLLGMLSLQRKFLLLGGLSLILFAVPLLLYVKASWETAAQKRLEAAGARRSPRCCRPCAWCRRIAGCPTCI